MREGFYERPIEAIIEEIKFLHSVYGITHFQFSDELLMSSVKRTEDICLAISRLPFKIKWDCNGRLNFATSTLLETMKTAGASYINYGIESLDQKILNQMGKGLTLERIQDGVEATLEAGLSPGLNLLWGFPGDTVENLRHSVKFLAKNDPCDELRTIRPVTPYPGCQLFNKAVKDGLIKDAEDFYENKHKNSDLFTVDFMGMGMEEVHRALGRANKDLIQNYLTNRATSSYRQADKLYLHGDTNFRGFRAV
jgi:anaerobic magnesium-protoporphyrin IX monomethyl ester cyclase